MSGFRLADVELPERGTPVEVRTAFEIHHGVLQGVVPGRPEASTRRDRQPKLALKDGCWASSIAEGDIRGILPCRQCSECRGSTMDPERPPRPCRKCRGSGLEIAD
jgi:DnaJ-class molecular chaperone